MTTICGRITATPNDPENFYPYVFNVVVNYTVGLFLTLHNNPFRRMSNDRKEMGLPF